ncbi:MAG: XdhC family protein [Candidatus Nanopelagicales bacterium]
MPEVDVWRALAGALQSGMPCALLAMADTRGSSPGRRGAVMAVATTGPLAGTIGGGVAEATLVVRAVADLRAGSLTAQRVPMEHRPGAPDASGMICGGSQVVVVSPLSNGDLLGITKVADALAAGRTARWSVDPQGWFALGEQPEGAGHAWTFQHCSGPTHTVHVIGAGHVGSALARLLVALDFRVVLVDERPGLATSVAEQGAHERIALAYEDLARVVAEGPASFAAIMTHSHERDAAALAALEPLTLGYLGLLGSKLKIARLVGAREMPGWFHAPMGLPIGSTTPTEIAVSIAAQMVAARSGVHSHSP